MEWQYAAEAIEILVAGLVFTQFFYLSAFVSKERYIRMVCVYFAIALIVAAGEVFLQRSAHQNAHAIAFLTSIELVSAATLLSAASMMMSSGDKGYIFTAVATVSVFSLIGAYLDYSWLYDIHEVGVSSLALASLISYTVWILAFNSPEYLRGPFPAVILFVSVMWSGDRIILNAVFGNVLSGEELAMVYTVVQSFALMTLGNIILFMNMQKTEYDRKEAEVMASFVLENVPETYYIVGRKTAEVIRSSRTEIDRGKKISAVIPIGFGAAARKIAACLTQNDTECNDEFVVGSRNKWLQFRVLSVDKHKSLVISRDVTERETKSREVIRMNEIMETVLKSVPVGMAMTDVKGNILFSNISESHVGMVIWDNPRYPKDNIGSPFYEALATGERTEVLLNGYGHRIVRFVPIISTPAKRRVLLVEQDITRQQENIHALENDINTLIRAVNVVLNDNPNDDRGHHSAASDENRGKSGVGTKEATA